MMCKYNSIKSMRTCEDTGNWQNLLQHHVVCHMVCHVTAKLPNTWYICTGQGVLCIQCRGSTYIMLQWCVTIHCKEVYTAAGYIHPHHVISCVCVTSFCDVIRKGLVNVMLAEYNPRLVAAATRRWTFPPFPLLSKKRGKLDNLLRNLWHVIYHVIMLSYLLKDF